VVDYLRKEWNQCERASTRTWMQALKASWRRGLTLVANDITKRLKNDIKKVVLY